MSIGGESTLIIPCRGILLRKSAEAGCCSLSRSHGGLGSAVVVSCPGGADASWLADTGWCLFCLSGQWQHNRQEGGDKCFLGSETEVGVTLLSSWSCSFRKDGVESA